MPLKNKRSMLFAAILITAFLCQFASADLVRFEAEHGLLGGDNVAIDTTGSDYSGDGFVTGFDQSTADPNDEMVTVTVYADAAGSYPLTIGFRSSYGVKSNNIFVNGIFDGLAAFPMETDFTELAYGNILLNAGTNTVSFATFEGWMHLDYFDIDGLTRQAVNPTPEHQSVATATTSQLCWTNPDAGPGDIITCDVYIGTTVPDGSADYGLTKIATDAWGSCADIPFDLVEFETYYWVVDCWDYNSGSPILLQGPSWEFTAIRKPIVFEAEDGLLSGPEVSVSTDTPGYSGTGYVTGFNQIDQMNEKVSVSVYAATAGDYPLTIGYRSDYGNKTMYLLVNDVEQATDPVFPLTTDWDTLEYGTIPLDAGMNTVTIRNWWGYMYVDYFMVDGLDPVATGPSPAHLATVGSTVSQLCWTNPAPENVGDTITADVYFGTDPNSANLPQIVAATTDTCVDIPGGVTYGQEYYWRVDCSDPSVGLLAGGLWSFDVGNGAPDPNVGPDQYVWLGQDGTPGEVIVDIDALVIDDGMPTGTLTYSWRSVAEDGPSIVIDPNDVEDISITFTEAGFYEFQLTVSDGDLQGVDNMYVGIGTNPCEAVQANPWWWAYDGDINQDCYVDLRDFALLAADWLNCLDPAGCQ